MTDAEANFKLAQNLIVDWFDKNQNGRIVVVLVGRRPPAHRPCRAYRVFLQIDPLHLIKRFRDQPKNKVLITHGTPAQIAQPLVVAGALPPLRGLVMWLRRCPVRLSHVQAATDPVPQPLLSLQLARLGVRAPSSPCPHVRLRQPDALQSRRHHDHDARVRRDVPGKRRGADGTLQLRAARRRVAGRRATQFFARLLGRRCFAGWTATRQAAQPTPRSARRSLRSSSTRRSLSATPTLVGWTSRSRKSSSLCATSCASDWRPDEL